MEVEIGYVNVLNADSNRHQSSHGLSASIAVSLSGGGNDGPTAGRVERRARIVAEHTASFGDTCRTYADCQARTPPTNGPALRRSARRRVAWLGANHPAFLEALFASATLGAALAPISHRLEPHVIDELIAEADPRVVLFHGPVRPPALPATVEAAVEVGPWDDGDCPYERLIAGHADTSIDERAAPDDLCLLPFTSGTTGRPKGVILTQANLTWNVVNGLSCLDLRGDDVTIAAAPFFERVETG